MPVERDINIHRPQQISFAGELLRKGTHMGALIIPASYYWFDFSRQQMLAFIIPATIITILIDIARLRQWPFWNRFASIVIGPMIRPHEESGDFTGATYILGTFCACVALFDKPIAVAALAFIIVGDTFAALIGRRFGRHFFGRKSLEGSLACLAGTLLVAGLTPQLSFTVAAFGAVVAAITEALSGRIDDNVTVPLISGTMMTLLTRIIANS